VVHTPAEEANWKCPNCATSEKARRDDLDRRGSAAARVHRSRSDEGEDPDQRRRRSRSCWRTRARGGRKLVDNGRSDRVLELRHDNQLTMREDLFAIVERQPDRPYRA